jgi:hypothetical protein
MIERALDVVENGPTPDFRIDLYQCATGTVSNGGSEIKGVGLMEGRLPEYHK